MNMTSMPVIRIQVMLMPARLWPTELASFTGQRLFLGLLVYSSKAFFFSSQAFLASTYSFSSLKSFFSGAAPGSAGMKVLNSPSCAKVSSPVLTPDGSGLAAGGAAAGA
jgi:hypothetical protein